MLLPFLVTAGVLSQLWAQPPLPAARGLVLDPTHSPIAGARITSIADGRTSGVPAESDQNGEFSLPLEPGKYTIKAAKEGFSEASSTVDLPSAGPELLDIVLQ